MTWAGRSSGGDQSAAVITEAQARSAVSAVVLTDAEGIVRSWSHGGFELLGFAAADALGRPLSELIVPPELRRAHEAALARLRYTGNATRLGGTFTLPALCADGSTTVVEVTLTAVEVGGDEWYLGVLRDQARQGDRSHALPPESVLQKIFERAPEAITILDEHGRQRTVNRAGARMFGFGEEGRFPGDARSFVHPDDLAELERRQRARLAGEEDGSRPVRYRVLGGDGQWHWLETVVADLRDVEELRASIAFSRDVTEDEQRRVALSTSLARLSAAIEALPAAAIEDSERRIAHHNERFASLVGHPFEMDLRGFDVRPLLRRIARSAVDAATVEEELARSARSAEVAEVGPISQVDGRLLAVEMVPIVEEGEVTGRMWMVRDVTDRIRQEQRLRELLEHEQDARRLAEERNELLDQLADARLAFVSTVSHELRTPLASIVSALDQLLDAGDPAPDLLGSYLQLMSRNTARLMRLVDDLLVVGRLDAGLISIVRVPLDVPSVLRETVADLAPAMAPRSISVLLDLHEGPPLAADDLRFRQILENLVGNAVKFGPDGGQILVACAVHDDEWWIDVANDGPGIPVDQRQRVFDPFARLPETEQSSVPGTGLGLAIVKGFVELHGGTVSIVDVPTGTHFRCRFPLAAPT